MGRGSRLRGQWPGSRAVSALLRKPMVGPSTCLGAEWLTRGQSLTWVCLVLVPEGARLWALCHGHRAPVPSLVRGSTRVTVCFPQPGLSRTLLMVTNSAEVHRGGRNNVTMSQRSTRRSNGVRAPCLSSTVASKEKEKKQQKMEMARKEGKEEVKEEREELVPDAIKRKLRGLPKPT